MMAETQPSRFEKSLGLLTTKFVSLLQKSQGGVLDLKVVSVCVISNFPFLIKLSALSGGGFFSCQAKEAYL